jgi:RimJ/RimL family protein N-acetyltransferase
MRIYKVLNKQAFQEGGYALIPIRHEDRYDIMRWRNEQIYHLRQNTPLTQVDQDKYFNNVINQLFDQEQPKQILFSFLEEERCIGYGGLVHINWENRNAELSFIMNTSLEATRFDELWKAYLSLIEKVAFQALNLHKVYTYAFDLRPHLYDTLTSFGYHKEAHLKDHVIFDSRYVDVLIHAKIK